MSDQQNGQQGMARQHVPSQIHYSELPDMQPDETLFHEYNTYRREAGRLLGEGHEGKWVLIKGEIILGVFPNLEAALAEGYERYHRQGFYIHQILEYEPVLRIRGYNMPWPSRIDIPSSQTA